MLTSRPIIGLALCLLAIGIVSAIVVNDGREATDNSTAVQATIPVDPDTGDSSSGFLSWAVAPDQTVQVEEKLTAKPSDSAATPGRDISEHTPQRVRDLGKDLNADDPQQDFDSAEVAIDIGEDVDADSTEAEVGDTPVKYADIGPDIDADDYGASLSDEPGETVDTGPDLDVEDRYRAAAYESDYPEQIGPDVDVEDLYPD